jgi:two-component system CheB/CheR fusion protein
LDLGEKTEAVMVAVGAAAAHVDSLERMLEKLPCDFQAPIVVVVQNAQAMDEAALLERLTAASGRKAVMVTDGVEPAPDALLLAPSSMVVTAEAGRLRLEPDQPVDDGAFNSLAVSLAAERQAGAVCIVLAGMGSSGMMGSMATKENGGLAIAEKAPEPPASSSASDVTDLVRLSPEEIPEHVAAYAHHLKERTGAAGQAAPREQIEEQVSLIAAILRGRTGNDFHGYKRRTFLRRVQRRMQVVQAQDMERYIDRLRVDPEEVQHLFQDLLIGVTQFFRDAPEFDVLERDVIPGLFEGRGPEDQVRVWALGCASGEEAYSLAILLREHMATLEAPPAVQVFATDIDGRALALARAGRYPETIEQDVTPARLARWFTKEGGTYCVVKELREMCLFSAHNVIRDPPFSRIDLISCRNLLIYLDVKLQDRVIPLFHFALRPGGVLFLGPSENVTRHDRLFAPIDRRHRIFRRQDATMPALPGLPMMTGGRRRSECDDPSDARQRQPDDSLARRSARMAERYAPAWAVVDADYEVLHFSGRTGRYLDPSAGTASLNLLNLVHRDIRLDLRAALHRAVTTGQTARLDRLSLTRGNEQLMFNIVVELVQGEAEESPGLLVLFQEAGSVPVDAEPATGAEDTQLGDEHARRLEAELRITKERLQAAIEELETTNEELKASNEEYQSVNEELQSANEELETSKEELQSVNEELQTVNGELAHRVNDLAHANSDLKNVLESTQIATVFLDNDLRVRNFTPAVTEVFHLIDTDIGRPITHIVPRVRYDELADDVRRVLRTLTPVEREVGSPRDGTRYIVRVLPYRSVDNFIAGAVLTFLDITAVARAETALHESEGRFRLMAQVVPAFLFTALPNGSRDYVNSRFYEYTGMQEGSALGQGWLAAMHPDDIESSQRRWDAAAAAGSAYEQELRMRSAAGTYRWFMVRAVPELDEQGRLIRWFGFASDVHERREAEARMRLLLAELQHRVRNILAVVRSVLTRTLETSDDLEDFAAHLSGRIGALARTQGVLARTGRGAVDLEELLREELVSQGGQDEHQVEMEGPQVMLRGRAVEALGLALHELTTNAIKYGALSTPRGHVSVHWRSYNTASGPRLALEWVESGMNLSGQEPERSGFGRELIEQGLSYELGATTVMEFRQSGLRCAIELPLPQRDEPLGEPA